MKKNIMVLVLLTALIGLTAAQEDQEKDGVNFYTVLVNIVNEPFRFPLIGLVNIARGSHNLPQIGLFNWNQNNFYTLQLSLANTAGGDTVGSQIGLVNTAGGTMRGLQLGFVNTAVNKINGAQISFVNVTRRLRGLQIGFINYTDSIESGVPIGFLSIVKNGGYKAIESGVSELSFFNVSFKIGIKELYTSFIVSYNPFRDTIQDQIIWGAGFGSLIPLGETFFLNPEILSYSTIHGSFQQYVTVIPYFGYTIIPQLSVVIGPSVTWVSAIKDIENPFYSMAHFTLNENNKLYLGARMALRFHW
jgi:hypothetical protein